MKIESMFSLWLNGINLMCIKIIKSYFEITSQCIIHKLNNKDITGFNSQFCKNGFLRQFVMSNSCTLKEFKSYALLSNTWNWMKLKSIEPVSIYIVYLISISLYACMIQTYMYCRNIWVAYRRRQEFDKFVNTVYDI